MEMFLTLLLVSIVVVGTHVGLFMWFARMIKKTTPSKDSLSSANKVSDRP